MIKRVLTVAALAAAAAAATAARADSGWYVSGDVGGYFRESEQEKSYVNTPGPPCPPTWYSPSCFMGIDVPATVSPHYTPGVVGHVAVGRRIFGKLRVEAEIGIASYSSDKAIVSGAGAGLNGDYPGQSAVGLGTGMGKDYRRYTEEVNLYYDLPKLPYNLVPYVGAGVGAAQARSGAEYYNSGFNHTSEWETHRNQPFVMLEGGISLKLTQHLSLVPSYRYQRAIFRNQDPEFKLTGGSPNTDIGHMFKLGLRYNF